MILDIRADIREVHEALKDVEVRFRTVHKKILSALTIQMRNKIAKQVYSKGLKKDDGTLKSSIYRWSKSDRTGVVGSSKQYIAQTHEWGKTIVPRKNASMVGKKLVTRYLWFKAKDGNWVKTKESRVPARPFFFATAQAFIDSPDFNKAIEKVVDSIIKKAGLNG